MPPNVLDSDGEGHATPTKPLGVSFKLTEVSKDAHAAKGGGGGGEGRHTSVFVTSLVNALCVLVTMS